MSLSVAQYPIFWPGDLPFFVSERSTWTKAQTEEWAAWLQRVVVPRTDFLLRFFSVDPALPSRERFAETVARAAALCASDPEAISAAPRERTIQLRGHVETIDVGPQPSGFALAIGIDLGLLAARSLQADYPETLSWEIIWKPKNDVSFRNPVLRSTTSSDKLDPLLIGQTLAAKLANGKIDREGAARQYPVWEFFAR